MKLQKPLFFELIIHHCRLIADGRVHWVRTSRFIRRRLEPFGRRLGLCRSLVEARFVIRILIVWISTLKAFIRALKFIHFRRFWFGGRGQESLRAPCWSQIAIRWRRSVYFDDLQMRKGTLDVKHQWGRRWRQRRRCTHRVQLRSCIFQSAGQFHPVHERESGRGRPRLLRLASVLLHGINHTARLGRLAQINNPYGFRRLGSTQQRLGENLGQWRCHGHLDRSGAEIRHSDHLLMQASNRITLSARNQWILNLCQIQAPIIWSWNGCYWCYTRSMKLLCLVQVWLGGILNGCCSGVTRKETRRFRITDRLVVLLLGNAEVMEFQLDLLLLTFEQFRPPVEHVLLSI